MAIIGGGRYAIVRHHFNEVRTAVFMDTLPKVLSLCYPTVPVYYNKGDTFLYFPESGAEIWALGLDDKERVDKVLGKEFVAMYFNECVAMSYHSVQTARTRVSQLVPLVNNKVFYDCNPTTKTHWAHRVFVEKVDPVTRLPLSNPELYASIKINPQDNIANLPQGFLEELDSLSPEKKARFLNGDWADDNEKALWKPWMINDFRVNIPPGELDAFIDSMERIIVGVDPAVTGSDYSDLTGIVVAGMRRDDKGENHYYILGDRSLSAAPQQWAIEVCNVFREYRADNVIAEVNNGGDLVTTVIRNVDAFVPVAKVHASRGKMIRAEPISVLYSKGLVHHVGEFHDLEEQMMSYTGMEQEKSPDRLDAMVWAMTELANGQPTAEIGHYGII